MSNSIRVLSLGKGVQSTTLAAMSALGELPEIDYIIHSNLKWERDKTCEIGDWHAKWLSRKSFYISLH